MNKLLLCTALCALASPALAAPESGRFSMSVLGGLDKPLSGDVHGGATVDVPDLGPLNPALAGVDAQLRIRSRGHDEIYGRARSLGIAPKAKGPRPAHAGPSRLLQPNIRGLIEAQWNPFCVCSKAGSRRRFNAA